MQLLEDNDREKTKKNERGRTRERTTSSRRDTRRTSKYRSDRKKRLSGEGSEEGDNYGKDKPRSQDDSSSEDEKREQGKRKRGRKTDEKTKKTKKAKSTKESQEEPLGEKEKSNVSQAETRKGNKQKEKSVKTQKAKKEVREKGITMQTISTEITAPDRKTVDTKEGGSDKKRKIWLIKKEKETSATDSNEEDLRVQKPKEESKEEHKKIKAEEDTIDKKLPKIPKRSKEDKDVAIQLKVDHDDEDFIAAREGDKDSRVEERTKKRGEEKQEREETPTIILQSGNISMDMRKLEEEVKRLRPLKIRKPANRHSPCMHYNLNSCRKVNVIDHPIASDNQRKVTHMCCFCFWADGANEMHSAQRCPNVRIKRQ